MILNYKGFLLINEANIKNKLKRTELKIGDDVMTIGSMDGVALDYKIGKIIAMREYGYILVEFEKQFSPRLHSGADNIGKENHCFYIKYENIHSTNREEFQKIIDNIGKEKIELENKLNTVYKEFDVVVGVGEIKNYYGTCNIDGEIGIVYYEYGVAPSGGPKNRSYWIGFLDKFNKILTKSNDGTPVNGAGLTVDKLHLRPITEEEREKNKDKIDQHIYQIKGLLKTFNCGDIVVIHGFNDKTVNGEIGVVMTKDESKNNVLAGLRYSNHYVKLLNPVIDYADPILGVQFNKTYLKLATEEEIKGKEDILKQLVQRSLDYNYDYNVGDWIISSDKNNPSLNGQLGKIVKITGENMHQNFTVEFLSHFSPLLGNHNGHKNCMVLYRKQMRICKDPKLDDLIKKLESGKVKPFIASDMLLSLMHRCELFSDVPLFSQSYFDVAENNVTFLPVDKIGRLESGEDPYKSRFRQNMGVGKFIRMIKPDLKERQVELLTNSFRANFDIIKGGMDKLKLVWGEDVRYWYNGKRYVYGGGTLNSSCMRGDEKGPEMQMFVDNPDTIQLLILTDDKDKLLGRALVWRLVQPYGQTFMDYVYTRYDKDQELFYMYADSKGWFTIGGGKQTPTNMVCALFNGKTYEQGRDALDHFDTYRLGHTRDYLTNNGRWDRPKDLVKPKWEGAPEVNHDIIPPVEKTEQKLPFPLNARVIYNKIGAANNNKKGIFVGLKDDGRAKIVFDDGAKYALEVEYLKETE